MRLHDQRVVIIGGTSAMGMALAEKALAEGASSVVVVGRVGRDQPLYHGDGLLAVDGGGSLA